MIINGNSLEELKKFPDNYFHSVVTDPPYGLVSITKRYGKENSAPATSNRKGGNDGFQGVNKGFMGKEWDGSGIEYNIELWKEVFRVLKEGGYVLAFGGTRTHHKLATAIEDAGFEIRDMIAWVYGSGFPKSHNIGKAVDKLQGNEREDLGKNKFAHLNGKENLNCYGKASRPNETKGTSEWEGWGTALKPALEPITMARKPFKGTVANNVLTNGVGGINIDDCRVEATETLTRDCKGWASAEHKGYQRPSYKNAKKRIFGSNNGRFPANFIHDGSDEVKDLFPYTKTGKPTLGDEGSASRFFYCAKASKKDRNEGLEDFDNKLSIKMDGGEFINPMTGISSKQTMRKNNHPTVKPTELMRYLVRLVTPKNGIVLDCFMGSGSTGKACALEGFEFVGIDLYKDYCEIAKARIDKALEDKKQDEAQTELF